LDTARRLVNDKHSPSGYFVYRLRLSPKDRLVYANTENIQVFSICEKNKWKYWWNEHYIVEVTKYEFWHCQNFGKNLASGVEIFLDRYQPNISYGVTLYRKSWEEDFASNCNLASGEVPDWHPTDMDKIGDVDRLLFDIGNFLKILQTKVPINKQNL